MTDSSSLRQSLAGIQMTLVAVVLLLLPLVVPDAGADVFAGLGILLALAGTGVVAFGLRG